MALQRGHGRSGVAHRSASYARRGPKRPDSQFGEGQAPLTPLLWNPPTGPLDPNGGTLFPVTGSLLQVPCYNLQHTGSGKAPALCRRHWCVVRVEFTGAEHLWGSGRRVEAIIEPPPERSQTEAAREARW